MKLPYLRTRKYKNKRGETWIGYYYEPPRGAGGEPGVKPKPVALGDQMVKGAAPAVPPGAVLVKYAEVTGKNVAMPARQGTVEAVYLDWLAWARLEVKAGRLAKRTLADYEAHWKLLKPVFGGGPINALTQALMLNYFDKRSSKNRAKREVNFIGLLCAWAKPRNRMQAENPVDEGLRLQLKVEKKAKAKPVSDQAYWVVWYCGDQLVKDTLDLSYMLATRPTEAIRAPMPPVGWDEMEAPMPKTGRSGRASKMVPRTPALAALVERRRALQPHSLYVLFDDKGQQLSVTGAIRSRFNKARKLAEAVCKEAGMPWVDFTRQQLRPTAITQIDRTHGRDEARKLAGHTTEIQTAHYVRHGAELVTTAALPAAPNIELQGRVEKILADLASKKPE